MVPHTVAKMCVFNLIYNNIIHSICEADTGTAARETIYWITKTSVIVHPKWSATFGDLSRSARLHGVRVFRACPPNAWHAGSGETCWGL